MLKAWVGSVALLSLSGASLGADEKTAEISTWRWHVAGILDAQRAHEAKGPVERVAFQQGYDRYSATGLPEAK